MRAPNAADRQARLERALPELVRRLTLPGIRRIVLFGSLATGRVGGCSDIDLLLVREDGRRFIERLDDVYRVIADLGLAVDALVYTPKELEELSRTRPFVRQALREGRVLYEA